MNSMHPSLISIEEYNYDLPQEKIAVYPTQERHDSKLLIYKNKTIQETTFKYIDKFLDNNSILIFNSSKVIQARLKFLNNKKQSIEIFCLEPHLLNQDINQAMSKQNNTRWNCLVGNLKKWIEKEIVIVTNNIQLSAQIVERYSTHVCIDFKWEPSNLTFSEILDYIGLMPIPPYIKRNSALIDKSRYQTIYSDKIGSVAAPTAGLHFTEEVLNAINKKEIKTHAISLHVGAGTFKPVKSKMMQGHDMHSEWIEVDLKLIIDLIENKKKVISVGTTSLRVIESLYWMGLKTYKNDLITLVDLEIKQWEVYELDDDKINPNECLQALAKWMQKNKLEKLICRTQILIAPPYQLKICDGIITNFHQPQSTLLLLISAIVGENWKKIYQYAIQNDFRFLSYGDSSLLLK